MEIPGIASIIPDGPLTWSGAKSPPTIGERVTISFNDLGAGEVVGYLVTHGYLAVAVKLDKNPEWRDRQGYPIEMPAVVYGAEILEQRA